MKIEKPHYDRMRDAVFSVLPCMPTAQEYVDQGIGKDPGIRHRWDALYKAGLGTFLHENVYPYADDSHIDTALRAIVAEFNACCRLA